MKIRTESELRRLTQKFQEDLKTELSAAGHIKTGRLSSSITVKFIKNDNMYELDIDSLSYLKYLENGDFLKRFLNKKKQEIIEVISKSAKEDIINQIKKKK